MASLAREYFPAKILFAAAEVVPNMERKIAIHNLDFWTLVFYLTGFYDYFCVIFIDWKILYELLKKYSKFK